MKAFLVGLLLGGAAMYSAPLIAHLASTPGEEQEEPFTPPSSEETRENLDALDAVDDYEISREQLEFHYNASLIDPSFGVPIFDGLVEDRDLFPTPETMAVIYKITPVLTITTDMISEICVYNAWESGGIHRFNLAVVPKDRELFEKVAQELNLGGDEDNPTFGLLVMPPIRPLQLGRFTAHASMDAITVRLDEGNLGHEIRMLTNVNPADKITPCGNVLPETLETYKKFELFFTRIPPAPDDFMGD